MIPFLDNLHVDKDINHRYRIQFQGSHKLKITKIATQKIARCNCAPIYMFQNKSDYLEFQRLLLLKDVVYRGDVQHIKNLKKDTQCRLETIRILCDPVSNARSILYFRTAKSSEQKPGFEEWPVKLFKDPKEPSQKCKSIQLESADGRSLSIGNGKILSRQSTQGSITTIGSQESTKDAYTRLGKGIKGLILEFHVASDCHEFWKEFMVRELIFNDIGGESSTSGLGTLPAELEGAPLFEME